MNMNVFHTGDTLEKLILATPNHLHIILICVSLSFCSVYIYITNTAETHTDSLICESG